MPQLIYLDNDKKLRSFAPNKKIPLSLKNDKKLRSFAPNKKIPLSLKNNP